MHDRTSRDELPASVRALARSGNAEAWASQAVLVAIIIIGYAGWQARNALPTPERGLGYWLGVTGAAMMLLLLLYPLRKRMRPQHWVGSVGLWFRVHMLLGLVGPLLVLYHARFTYSATNSAVALVTMLVVAGSGLTGRFIYGHVHRGFSQRKLQAADLRDEVARYRSLLDTNGSAGHDVVVRLEAIEREAVLAPRTFWGSLVEAARTAVLSRYFYWQLARRARANLADEEIARKVPRQMIIAHQHALDDHLLRYLRAIRGLGGLAFWNRMFRAWHYLHLPLFFFLLTAAVLHVIAVHMY